MFTTEQIVNALSLPVLKQTSKEIMVECPFCGDSRGKASFSIRKNAFNCFICTEKGSSFEIYKRIKGVNTATARKQIAQASADYTPSAVTTTEDTVASPVEIRDAVYRSLMGKCHLTKKHREDLKKRGLTDEQIKKIGFFSFPDKDKNPLICKELLKEGFVLEGIPGFYTQDNEWRMAFTGQGYFCPVYDTRGKDTLLTGFQIRLDNPIKGNKYVWFSSSGKPHGTGSGAQCCFLRGRNKDTILITEGILKATITYILLNRNVTVIGVPGVNNLASLKNILPEKTGYFAFLAYDMDKKLREQDIPLYKEACKELRNSRVPEDSFFKKKQNREKYHDIWKAYNIANAESMLKALLESRGIQSHSLSWDTTKDKKYWKGNIKGIDDFLLSYIDKDKFIEYILRLSREHLEMEAFLQREGA